MMRSNRLSALSAAALLALGVALASAGAASAEWPFVYGPRHLVKADDSGQAFQDGFDVALKPGATYRIALHNGDQNGEQRVESAEVYLNGSEVVSKADFTSLNDKYEVEVHLREGRNQIAITTSGPAGSLVTMAIIGRERETGFLWGGLISLSWLGVGNGAGEGVDALVQLKAIALDAPTAFVISLFNKEGERVFHTKPLLLKNHASMGANIEELLKNLGEDYDGNLDPAIEAGWADFSVEVAWISAAPARMTGSGTWLKHGEDGVALHVPFDLIGVGRIECNDCQDDPNGRAATLRGSEILERTEPLRGRNL
ncbi:MAG: hypothetical protein HYV63_20805 [Candidatus Schekmanbacteria bacterium]|nr:hypothetical protein [Candidatus Schekmanbacteria bacterium]